jgi:DNA-binding LacI/PurR family transcriptional regulator
LRLEKLFHKVGARCIISDVDDLIPQNNLSGFFYLGNQKPDDLDKLSNLASIGLLGSIKNGEACDRVSYSQEMVAILAAQKFKDMGCKEVSIVTAQGFLGAERAEYFYQQCKELGMKCSVIEHHFQTAIKSILGNKNCDGIFVTEDHLLLALYSILDFHGKIPMKDYVICGCNDVESRSLEPRPFSINLNLDQIADLAYQQMLFKMKSPHAQPTHIKVHPYLSGSEDP